MSLLTLCMPSNRNLERSRRAIEQALAYCEARNVPFVISDNSGDPEKEKFWRERSPLIRYLTADGTDALTNFLDSVSAADTPFILQIGDDDGISFDPAVPAFDLASLTDDFMGVRVKTLVEITGHGLVRAKEFSIDAMTPGERILEYSQKAGGDNSAFYSIFRREPYLNLMKLFTEQHPTKGGFSDWAMSLALFSYGRMAYDPGTIYHYNADQWAGQEKVEKKNLELFAAAGLPPHTTLFQPLLMALDVFVFVGRPGTPLSRDEALNAISMASGGVLDGFLGTVTRAPDQYSETVRYLVDLAREEKDAFARFQLALMMADQLKPGLKDGYVAFYRAANGL